MHVVCPVFRRQHEVRRIKTDRPKIHGKWHYGFIISKVCEAKNCAYNSLFYFNTMQSNAMKKLKRKLIVYAERCKPIDGVQLINRGCYF